MLSAFVCLFVCFVSFVCVCVCEERSAVNHEICPQAFEESDPVTIVLSRNLTVAV